MSRRVFLPVLGLIAVLGAAAAAFDGPLQKEAVPDGWRAEFPKTDFSRHAVPYDSFRAGGPPRDGIPPIDDPRFVEVGLAGHLADDEPVIGLTVNGESKAYPVQVLMWHEIVNDRLGGVPVAVTFCPLCNAAVVFDRRLDGRVLDFGTTGRLRKSDLVMYDRQTESWWQQFEGRAVVGALTGEDLTMLPARLESFAEFRKRAGPQARVLVPTDPGARNYGRNPYGGYDRAARPFFYDGDLPEDIPAMARVVAVGDTAWSLALLRDQGTIREGDLVLEWVPGQRSALDSRRIEEGREVGGVVATRNGDPVVHHVVFAFVFHAFRPDGVIHTR